GFSMKGFPIRYFYFLILLILFSCGEESEPRNLAALQLLDEAYGTHPKQNMDVFLPAARSSEKTPLLIYIHGGGWVEGDKAEFLQFKAMLEQEFSGYAFASLNYRLFDFATASYGISDQEQDIIAALDYIESQLETWNISNDLVISGAS